MSMLFTRDTTRLAAAINAGLVKFNHTLEFQCTTEGCTNPLLEPIAFNATSRIDGEYICEGCREWETTQGTKCPQG
jgi:hypothetical protein